MNIRLVSDSRNHMATSFDLQISCGEHESAQARRTLEECHYLVAALENELSEYRDSSPIRILNQAAPGVRVQFSESGSALMKIALRMRSLSRGAFDATARSKVQSKIGSAPSASRIGWDPLTGEAWRNDLGAHLGFGAIGKGFALDRVRVLIEMHGFENYLLSAGGSSILMSGFAAPAVPWSWAWSWKKDEQGYDLGVPFTHDSGHAIAIGVSGTHEKGEHILDPATGTPASPSQSALIAVSSAAEADALSTALYVSGWAQGMECLAQLQTAVPAVAAIDPQGVPIWNGIFDRLWKVPAQWSGRWSDTLLLMIATGWLTLSSAAAQDETVDLSTLGMNDFTPYVTERNHLWVLLPAITLGAVLVHLKKYRIPIKPQKRKGT